MKRITLETDLNILHGEKITFAHVNANDRPCNHRLHLNSYYEIYVFVRGDADYTVKDQYFSLTRGDVIIISPYEVHKAILKSPCEYERFYFLIPTDAFSDFRISPLSDRFIELTETRKRVSPDGETRSAMLNTLYDMSRLATLGGDGNRIALYGEFLKFLSLLSAALFSESDPVPSFEKTHIPLILPDILRYIDRGYTEIESARQLASRFSISASYLSTLFSRHIGVTFSVYLQILRVAKAKLLLEQGHSVTDVCYTVGFGDCSYFIKIFRKHVGQTPLCYQKTHLRAPSSESLSL